MRWLNSLLDSISFKNMEVQDINKIRQVVNIDREWDEVDKYHFAKMKENRGTRVI